MSEADEPLTLAVGERFELQLGQGYDWELAIADGRVLNRLEEGPGGGVFLARQPGETELTAVGDPECLKVRPPCAMPSVFYSLLVIVH
jgi:hypothetical protein